MHVIVKRKPATPQVKVILPEIVTETYVLAKFGNLFLFVLFCFVLFCVFILHTSRPNFWITAPESLCISLACKQGDVICTRNHQHLFSDHKSHIRQTQESVNLSTSNDLLRFLEVSLQKKKIKFNLKT